MLGLELGLVLRLGLGLGLGFGFRVWRKVTSRSKKTQPMPFNDRAGNRSRERTRTNRRGETIRIVRIIRTDYTD